MNKFRLTASNTIHPPKNENKGKLITWTSGDGEINKRLGYILIGSNMKNWLNYAKAKGTANINGISQHRIIYMEIRAKFKQKKKR